METKVCRKCDIEKPIGSFPKRYPFVGVREHICGMCNKRRHVALDPTKAAENKRQECLRRRARAKGMTVEAYAESQRPRLPRLRPPRQMCPLLTAYPSTEQLEERAEKDRIKSRAYYHANKGKARLKVKKWKQNNPGLLSAQRYRRRMNRDNTVNDLTTDQWNDIKATYRYRCAYCHKRRPLTMDHSDQPVVDGGPHTASNIVPACRSCNSSKGAGPARVVYQPHLIR